MPAYRRTAWGLTALIVVVLVALSHAWSLDAGLYLDDHSHYAQMRDTGWSYHDAVHASRLGIIGRVMYLWFQEDAGLHFYRPVAFWLMKAEYTLVGWHPMGAHVFSLLWHVVASMLVYTLACRCVRYRRWAGVAAAVFAAHPGHVLTVYWIACQTELMVVTFILSAVLCYQRYSNWPTPMFADRSRVAGGPPPGGGHIGWLAGACLFFALALGCRENAVVFPVVAVMGDLLLRPRQWRRRIMPYLIFAVIFSVYFWLRSRALGGFPVLGRPYMVPPGDPEFFLHLLEKTVYYVLGLFALFPVLPIGGLVYFHEHQSLFYGVCMGVIVVWALWLILLRRHRGLMWAPLWVGLSMAPVLALFASGHHLYLPGVGTALMVAAFWAWLIGSEFGPPVIGAAKLRAVLGAGAVALHLVLLPGACWAFGWVFRTSTQVEDLLIQEVVELTPELHDGDRLFFINLSMMAYYGIPAIEEQTGTSDLRGYVMTFSPKLLMMEEPCRVDQIDAHTFSVSLDRYGYFAGEMGKVLREGMGRAAFFKPGEQVQADEFEAIVDDVTAEGVRKLTFRFRKPLTSPDYHFYLGSRYRVAYPLTWDRANASTSTSETSAIGG